MLFRGTEQSDFARCNPIKAKTAYNKTVFKNGARYCAIIGLIFMMIISSWDISWS